ncbi:MAG: ABC transporter permease subunit [Clostridiales bacterium]|nr:ABC transporter permease subunit [Clostridiales bacterium]
MSVPFLLYRILFSYVPLTGWTMAFQNYKPQIRNMWDQQWVGFDNFENLISGVTSNQFWRDFRNTLGQSVLTLILGYVCAIVLSLLLNEVKNVPFKRIIQNITYMPHFLSWIVVTGLVSTMLALPTSGGIINVVLMKLGFISEPVLFLNDASKFWGIVAGSHLWKELGWNTIIYLAAMTAIDPTLYEAAEMDGANRYHKMWHITLPSIRPTIVILLIMSTGYLLESGFEIQYFLGRGVNAKWAETIDIFVLRYGISQSQYHLATVAGILKTGISVIVVGFVNFIAGRLGSDKLI